MCSTSIRGRLVRRPVTRRRPGRREAEHRGHVASSVNEAQRTPLEAVASHFADDRALLVLDNCEHVVGAVGGVRGRAAPRVPRPRHRRDQSRVPERRRGDHLPRASHGLAGSADADPAAILDYDGVELFVDRVHHADPRLRARRRFGPHDHGDLPSGRRAAPGHRAGHGPRSRDAARRHRHHPRRPRRRPRRRVPHRPAPPTVGRRLRRVELRAVGGERAPPALPAVGIRGKLLGGCRRGRLCRRRPVPSRRAPDVARSCRQVARGRRRRPVHALWRRSAPFSATGSRSPPTTHTISAAACSCSWPTSRRGPTTD